MLEFPVSRTVGRRLLYKLPSLRYSPMATENGVRQRPKNISLPTRIDFGVLEVDMILQNLNINGIKQVFDWEC